MLGVFGVYHTVDAKHNTCVLLTIFEGGVLDFELENGLRIMRASC